MIKLAANTSDALHTVMRSRQVEIDAVKVSPFMGMDRVRTYMADFHGCNFLARCLRDRHDLLTEEDYNVLASLLAQSAPRAVTLEYWKDEHQQAHILRRLRAMLPREVQT